MLAGWLQGMFWAAGGMTVILFFADLIMISARNDVENAGLLDWKAWERYDSAEEMLGAAVSGCLLVGVAVFVLLIIWSYQAVVGTQVLSSGKRQWSSGWAIGGWFIPIASWLIPLLVLLECEKLALANAPKWRQTSGGTLGRTWWILWIASSAGIGIGSGQNGEGAGPAIVVLSTLGFIGASACGALYVRWLTRTINEACMTA